MKCIEIIKILEELAPRECACDWDNPGLLAGREDKEVGRILLTLDADDACVERAIGSGADMIVSHHPMIFHPLKKVSDEYFIGRRLMPLIRADISYYAMHTNFDAAPNGMGDACADLMGITNGEPLEMMGELNGVPYGIGKIGELKAPSVLMDFAQKIKETFGLPCLLVYGSDLYGSGPLKRVATCPGSGGDEIGIAIEKGAQVLVTGDISHHEGIDAAAQGLAVFDAGHYGLEHIFMDYMESYLGKKLPDDIIIDKMPVKFPYEVI